MSHHVSRAIGVIFAFVCLIQAHLFTTPRTMTGVRSDLSFVQDHRTDLIRQQETVVGGLTRADNRARWNAELYNRPMRRF